jgi:hypothetical protein
LMIRLEDKAVITRLIPAPSLNSTEDLSRRMRSGK